MSAFDSYAAMTGSSLLSNALLHERLAGAARIHHVAELFVRWTNWSCVKRGRSFPSCTFRRLKADRSLIVLLWFH